MAAFPLEVNSLIDASLAEKMVAASNAFLEAQTFE